MREYEVLFRYLKNSNWNKDGSPSNDDCYYMIGRVKADDRKQVQKWVDNNDEYAMLTIGKCEEIFELFASEEYVEETLEVVKVLSEVGHEI